MGEWVNKADVPVVDPADIKWPKPEAKVVISHLWGDEVAGIFTKSLMSLLLLDGHEHGPNRIIDGGGYISVQSGPNLLRGRNQQVEKFLEMCDAEPSIEYLMIVDSDMAFEPVLVERLLDVCDKETAPIVGGLCFVRIRGEDGRWYIWPTIMHREDADDIPGKDRWYRQLWYPENAMVQCGATGTACLMVHKSVLYAMRDAYADKHPWEWFYLDFNYGDPLGEDISFCKRAGEMGYPIFVHTGVKVGHYKGVTIDHDMYVMPSKEEWLAMKDTEYQQRFAGGVEPEGPTVEFADD